MIQLSALGPHHRHECCQLAELQTQLLAWDTVPWLLPQLGQHFLPRRTLTRAMPQGWCMEVLMPKASFRMDVGGHRMDLSL